MKHIFTILLINVIVSIWPLMAFEGMNLQKSTGEDIADGNPNYTSDLIPDSFKLAIVPPSSGVKFYKDGIIFLAPTKNMARMIPEHLSFGTLDAYYAWLGDSLATEYTVFSPTASFPYPVEAVTFSNDYETMYFTKVSNKEEKEKIYKALFVKNAKGNKWEFEKTPVHFSADNYRYTHPALSADGKIMVFASNRKGTKGGMDLFVTRNPGSIWSEPEIIGNGINSTGNELFPFLDEDNNLYFSSDGHQGLGGYDIFVSRFNGHDWDPPLNLSGQINSKEDDVAFNLNPKNKREAFLTRKAGMEAQLYRMVLPHNLTDPGISLSSLLIFSAAPLTQRPVTAAQPAGIPAKTEPEVQQTPKTEKPEPVVSEKTKPQPPAVVSPVPERKADAVVYRVQILSSTKPKGSVNINLDGDNYTSYEYLYKGAYRTTIGEFKNLAEAVAFQSKCRKVYPQAFVAAFKNGVRSLDPALFR